MAEQKDVIRLTDTDPHKGPHLSLWSDDVDKIETFKFLCYANLPKELHWFHQCNTRTYQMFEFWKPFGPEMRSIGSEIAQAMELLFLDDLNSVYLTSMKIEHREFQSFDADFHTFNNFSG